MSWLIVLIIGGVAGWLGSLLMGNAGNGILSNVLLGMLGGLVGNFFFSLFSLQAENNLVGFLVTATVGSALLILIGRLISGKS